MTTEQCGVAGVGLVPSLFLPVIMAGWIAQKVLVTGIVMEAVT